METTMQPQMRILRRRDVEAMCGIKKSTLYELMGAGSFPKPIHLGSRVTGWIESEIVAWIRDRIAVRDA